MLTGDLPRLLKPSVSDNHAARLGLLKAKGILDAFSDDGAFGCILHRQREPTLSLPVWLPLVHAPLWFDGGLVAVRR